MGEVKILAVTFSLLLIGVGLFIFSVEQNDYFMLSFLLISGFLGLILSLDFIKKS